MFATPKNPAASRGDSLTKDDIVGALIVLRLDEYDPARSTSYGATTAAFVDVTVLDGPHAGKHEPRLLLAGNVGRQVGEQLDVGALAPGRIVSGTSPTGRSWFGIEWSVGDELAEAERLYTAALSTVDSSSRI